MTSVANLNNFNNLLYNTKRYAFNNYIEHLAGRVPLDLRYKGEAPVVRVLGAGPQQLNGKHSDIKYLPSNIKHSSPNYGYDARMDPTILNAVRNRYVDVSGLLIPNFDLPKNKTKMNTTVRPLKPIGIVV